MQTGAVGGSRRNRTPLSDDSRVQRGACGRGDTEGAPGWGLQVRPYKPELFHYEADVCRERPFHSHLAKTPV